MFQLRTGPRKCPLYVYLTKFIVFFSLIVLTGLCVVFWEQQGLQTFGHKIQITRPHASQPAFEKHFANLIEEYRSVHAINLLGTKENEAILSSSYANHLQHAKVIFADIGMTNFDFHNVVRYAGHEAIIHELRYV